MPLSPFQDCTSKHNNGGGGGEVAGSGDVKQNLVRTTLAKQTLEIERKELLKRIDDLESTLTAVKAAGGAGNGEKGSGGGIRAQLEELIKKHGTAVSLRFIAARRIWQRFPFTHFNARPSPFQALDSNEMRALYDEEFAVAKDAISNLRTSFK